MSAGAKRRRMRKPPPAKRVAVKDRSCESGKVRYLDRAAALMALGTIRVRGEVRAKNPGAGVQVPVVPRVASDIAG